MNPFLRFLFSLTLLTAFVFVSASVFFHYFPEKQPAGIYYIYLYFFAITAIVHYILMKAAGKRAQQFPAHFMMTTSIKLFSSFMFIVPYVYINKSEATRFLLTFFLFYVLYTVFEIVSVLRYLKTQKGDLKQ